MTMCDDRDGLLEIALCQKHRHHTIVTDRHALKFRRGAGSPFQRAALASQRAQNLLTGRIFDSSCCQKCFCVTLGKSNRTRVSNSVKR